LDLGEVISTWGPNAHVLALIGWVVCVRVGWWVGGVFVGPVSADVMMQV
jgi:hypothetical protein